MASPRTRISWHLFPVSVIMCICWLMRSVAEKYQIKVMINRKQIGNWAVLLRNHMVLEIFISHCNFLTIDQFAFPL